MSLGEIENGLQTLRDYPGHVGLMGGEPTMHPKFAEICKLYQKYVPVKARRELWTAGYKWKEYKDLIHETFYPELIAYNEHLETQPCWHQPLQIAINRVIEDSIIRYKVIDNCWVQQRWSASITPMGAYFCEVAAARAAVFGNPKGLPVIKDWWKKGLSYYQYQKMALCNLCSACLPMPLIANDNQEWDDVSENNYKRLKEAGSPKLKQGKCKVYDVEQLKEYYKGHKFEPQDDYEKRGGFKDFPDWEPWNYRALENKAHGPKEAVNQHPASDHKQTEASL
jgi:hypothetical protein